MVVASCLTRVVLLEVGEILVIRIRPRRVYLGETVKERRVARASNQSSQEIHV